MSARVLVRSSMVRADLVILACLGAGMFLVGAFVAVRASIVVGGVVAAGGLAFMLGIGTVWWYRVRNRLWVEDQGNGFLVIDAEGERRVADDQVVSSALIETRKFAAGVFHATTRRFIVWLTTDADRPERMEMRNEVPARQQDPLRGLIDRLNQRLAEQARQELRSGRSALGECWTWAGGQLNVRMPRETVACPIAEVVAANPVDGDLCVWRRGQDRSFARVPLASANAAVLSQLLTEHIAQQPDRDEPPPEGQLGRIIFERSPSRGTAGVLVVLAGGALCLAIIFAVAALGGQMQYLLIALGLLGGAVVAGLGAVHAFRATFRCHEYGVHQSGLLGARQLPYRDVQSFSYAATRHFVNGMYSGTAFALAFEPMPERAGNRIGYSVRLQNADQELDNLRDHISRVIAARMARDLKEGRPATWTPQLRFLAEGVEHNPVGLFGRKGAFVIPYSDIANFTVEKGFFYLWARGKPKPIITEAIAAANFFPGFYLLASMADSSSRSQ